MVECSAVNAYVNPVLALVCLLAGTFVICVGSNWIQGVGQKKKDYINGVGFILIGWAFGLGVYGLVSEFVRQCI